MSLQSTVHFNASAVLGSQEISTDEQKYDRGTVQMRVNLLCPINARADQTIMPVSNKVLSFELTKVFL
jgi:hypothetical protein